MRRVLCEVGCYLDNWSVEERLEGRKAERKSGKWCDPGGWVRLKDSEDFLVVEYLFPDTRPVPLTK